jgi:ribosomal protein S18 acetylase RimI-like enzyme
VPDVREAVFPDDADAIARIDTSFTTDTIYVVRLDGDDFTIVPTPVDPPIVKSFPIDGLGGWRAWERAWVATANDAIVGFCAVRDQQWNRQLVLWHLYVDRSARGQGYGHALLETAIADARANDAYAVWLETSNLDYPAVQWYRAHGFELCGLDTLRYEPTYASGETALYMARRLSST